MPDIKFKYDLDQLVTTVFGDSGIISMLGFDEGGQKYFVQTKQDGMWLKEDKVFEHIKD